MNSKKFFGRLLPFFATFLVGIFVASFFVTIGGPNFRSRGWERHRDCQRMRFDYERMREENLRLKNELQSSRMSQSEWSADDESVRDLLPPPPPLPAKPAAPRAVR